MIKNVAFFAVLASAVLGEGLHGGGGHRGGQQRTGGRAAGGRRYGILAEPELPLVSPYGDLAQRKVDN